MKIMKPLLLLCLVSTPIIVLAEAEADGGSTPEPYLGAEQQSPPQKNILKQKSTATTEDSTQARLTMLYQDKGMFYRFDHELREALKSGSAEKLAFLVHYPLTVYGTEWGENTISDAKALQQNYDKIFTKEIIDAVLKTETKDIFSNSDGIRYFNEQNGNSGIGVRPLSAPAGEEGPIYKIKNVYQTRKEDAKVASNEAEIKFECETKKHRIVIDYLPNEDYRYRSWNKPKSLTEKPDMELSDPKAYELQGHGMCSYDMWEFKRGDTKFRVDGAGGCGESAEPSKGYLQVFINGEEKLGLPCL